mgnify:CR=1 FL=1
MKKLWLFFLCVSINLLSLMAKDYAQYVDPRIGSEGLGRTFPGPCMPYGMAKPGPDAVSMPNAGWAPMPELIKGFSQMHVSGTGGGQKYGNVLIQPFLSKKNGRYRFTAVDGKGAVCHVLAPHGEIIEIPLIEQKRTSEKISLGYYACSYEDGIQTEITSSERCAFYRITYRKEKEKYSKSNLKTQKESLYQEPCLLIDAVSFLGMDTIVNKRETQQLVDAHVEQVDGRTIQGWTTVRGGWNNGGPYTVFFYIEGDGMKTREKRSHIDTPFGKGAGEASRWLTIPVKSEVLNLKVGISHVSIEQAKLNIPSCKFDVQVAKVRKTWNEKLKKIEISSTEKQKRMFYTGIYHTMLMPVDKSGENPHFSASPYYDDYYAIWDTYRTSMPLLTLIDEDKQRDMVNSLLNIYKHDGYMPDARSGNWNGRTQGGSNAEIVIADAFAKKLKGIDYELALQAMLKDAEVPPTDSDGYYGSIPTEKHGRGGLLEYNSLGYIPYGIDRAGNRTVEYSYNDWCIAQVAKGLNHLDLYEKYMKRSDNWRNLWRSDYEWQGMKGFIMPRDKDGRWLDSVPWGKSKVYHPMIPYRPDTKVAPWYLPWWSTFFYEALSAEYSLSIPHDVPGLIVACGGKEAFVKRLDTFFANGHYNVANEPSFMTPYLYHWADCPQRSVNRIYQIVNNHYDDTPDGLPGNDDSGAMSSWLVFNMLGLYPVAGQNLYLVGMPMFPEYTVHLSNGKKLRVVRESEEEAYKRRIAERENKNFDDKWKRKFITHDMLISGGKLVLPFCYVADNPVDKGVNALKDKKKEKSTTFSHTVDNYLKTIPTECVSHFVLNRQYRNWEVGVDSMSVPDTLLLKCNQSVYLIPRKQLDEADGFCWDNPQKGKNLYVCDKKGNNGNSDGTFLFISRKALRQLLDTGSFVYNGIQWKQISRDAESVTVKAEQDGTMMQIATNRILPWVLRMENNPLGIDWKLEWR